jgi:glycosyltransferase involved in cell wall biosynthesis
MKKLRIAQVAPLYESVPPKLYGGTERVVAHLTEELVRQGHEVSLFASGDSETSSRLIACCPQALRLGGCIDPLPHHLVMVEEVYRRAEDFDVIHFHIDYLHFMASRRQLIPHVTTLHGRLDLPDLVPLYREFHDMPVVSISNAQRAPLPWLNWRGTIHHGLPEDLFTFRQEPEEYLAFLGRISPEKGLERAIEIARRVGLTLRIAAKVDRADQEYYEQAIRPLLGQPGVEFLGEINDREKQDFLGNARGLLFPIDWPEPFGLVMIEAMACGTPLIAFPRGSVTEVVDPGETGFVCSTVEEAVAAVGRLSEISRRGCRQVFERRFSAARMARDYVDLYHRQLEGVIDGRRDHPDQRAVLHPRHELARR